MPVYVLTDNNTFDYVQSTAVEGVFTTREKIIEKIESLCKSKRKVPEWRGNKAYLDERLEEWYEIEEVEMDT